MKRSTKILLGVAAGTAVVGGIAFAVTRKPPAPTPVDPASLPASVLGSELEQGWTTFGWYTYQGKSASKLWIRIDKGPAQDGTVLDDLPWRWTVFVDKPLPEGGVPIATGEKSWTDLGVLYKVDALASYADDEMASMAVRAAADQIDAMYGGGA